MTKTIIITLAFLLTGVSTAVSQEKKVNPGKEKRDQSELFNDLYFSYGTGTAYYYIDNENLKANSLSGTFLIGFCRSLNKIIAVGFQVSYTNIGRSGSNYDYTYSTTYTEEMTDNLWQGIANIRFRYLNTPTFCMYSGIGIGVTMDYYNKTYNSTTSRGQKLFPAGQLTLLGFRFGRAFSFFGEFGLGTNSILNCGISYKFSD